MKFLESKKKAVIASIALAAIFGAVGFASKYIFGNDNAIEQAAEAMIEKQTGLNVDLSPSKTKSEAKVSYRPQ